MFKLAAIFTDHMVLQRRKPIPVWGSGEPGREVRVSLDGEMRAATVQSDGQWRVTFDPMEAGASLTLAADCEGEQILCADVCLGEVWLAGGQSNMEMKLAECADGTREIAASAGKSVRFYAVPRCAVTGEELARAEAESCWKVCAPETSGELSAVAWFFAEQVARSQGVTVGIVDCCWGGTSVTCWMSRERLAETSAGRTYLDAYAELAGDKSEAQYRREMEAYNAEWSAWNDRVEALRAREPLASWETIHRACGECPWPQPAGWQSPFRPAGLYETMLARACPFALRGFIYYQGEEDTSRPALYAGLLAGLIDQWRGDWDDGELPFLFVQLPMYCSADEYARGADDKHWALLRDAQREVSRTVAHTGMAVMIDGGEFDNIHPTDKRTVGVRLALQARRKVYGEDVIADGPSPVRVQRQGNRLEVEFSDTAGALKAGENIPKGFELAGADGVYYSAKADLLPNGVSLWSDDVPAPETVRYAWTNYGPANLYSAAGLPAVPFRTDEQAID